MFFLAKLHFTRTDFLEMRQPLLIKRSNSLTRHYDMRATKNSESTNLQHYVWSYFLFLHFFLPLFNLMDIWDTSKKVEKMKTEDKVSSTLL